MVTYAQRRRRRSNEPHLFSSNAIINVRPSCIAYTIRMAVFDWDQNNLKKIRAHRIKSVEVEEALSRGPILIYEQDADEERYVYYGETRRGRLLAMVLTERKGRIRVITAYDLDAGQKRDYLKRRAAGE
jgi:uncharacterized DUF497 family protein